MKNITVSLDDAICRRVRMIAAERDTSVSALVRRFLVELGSEESETERLNGRSICFAKASLDSGLQTGSLATTSMVDVDESATFPRHEYSSLFHQQPSGRGCKTR